jgi:hypothetical protein
VLTLVQPAEAESAHGGKIRVALALRSGAGGAIRPARTRNYQMLDWPHLMVALMWLRSFAACNYMGLIEKLEAQKRKTILTLLYEIARLEQERHPDRKEIDRLKSELNFLLEGDADASSSAREP